MRSLFKVTGVVAVVAAAVLTFVPVAAAKPSKVLASDACSPSFNDAFDGPDLHPARWNAVRRLHPQLQRNKFAGAWHFSPPHVNLDAGDR